MVVGVAGGGEPRALPHLGLRDGGVVQPGTVLYCTVQYCTVVHQEPGPACRTAAALLAALATAAARVFLLSATMVISPLAGLGVLCSLYLASTVLHLCSGEGLLSLAHAYFR